MPASISCSLISQEEPKKEVPKKEEIPMEPVNQNKPNEPEKIEYRAILVSSTFPQGVRRAGETIEGSFEFKNAGSQTWKKDTFKFEYTNGDLLHTTIIEGSEDVAPGENLDVQISFTLPQVEKTTKVCEFMSLKNFCPGMNGALFGPKVWFEASVEPAEERSSLEESLDVKP